MKRQVTTKAKMKMNKTVDDYLALPYTLEIIPDHEEGGWLVKVRELRGCMTQVDQWDDVLPLIQDAMRLWIEAALEFNDPIPEPLGQAT